MSEAGLAECSVCPQRSSDRPRCVVVGDYLERSGIYRRVGAVTNTFGVPGVTDHCFFLKSAEDAKAIRERVNACFELANLPDSTEEDRKRLLSFVVVRS